MCREVEMQNRQGGTSGGSRSIRSTGPTDRDWITQFLYDRWAADFVVVHGEVIKPADLPALTRGQGEGLATYRLLGEDAELVTLDAIPAGKGRSWSGWGQKCPADEKYPNCVSDLPYLRDKDSLPTDSVQFALSETRSSIR